MQSWGKCDAETVSLLNKWTKTLSAVGPAVQQLDFRVRQTSPAGFTVSGGNVRARTSLCSCLICAGFSFYGSGKESSQCILICTQQHSIEVKGKYLISGTFHIASCLWAKLDTFWCINENVLSFVLAFICILHVQSEGMQTHMLENKKTIFMLHIESLSSWGLKANAPKHMASVWYFLSVWTLADSPQNVTVWWPMVNVWMGMHERKLIYFSSPNSSLHW